MSASPKLHFQIDNYNYLNSFYFVIINMLIYLDHGRYELANSKVNHTQEH